MLGNTTGRRGVAVLAGRSGGAVPWQGIRLRLGTFGLAWRPDVNRDAMFIMGILVGLAQAGGWFAVPVDALAVLAIRNLRQPVPDRLVRGRDRLSVLPTAGGSALDPAPADRVAGIHPHLHGRHLRRILVLRTELVPATRRDRDPVLPRHRPELARDALGLRADRQPPVDPGGGDDPCLAPPGSLGPRGGLQGHHRDRLVVARPAR